jgi:hypothetical protein
MVLIGGAEEWAAILHNYQHSTRLNSENRSYTVLYACILCCSRQEGHNHLKNGTLSYAIYLVDNFTALHQHTKIYKFYFSPCAFLVIKSM